MSTNEISDHGATVSVVLFKQVEEPEDEEGAAREELENTPPSFARVEAMNPENTEQEPQDEVDAAFDGRMLGAFVWILIIRCAVEF